MARQFPTGISLNGQRAQNASDPTASTDLATKAYTDNKIDSATVPLVGGVAAAGTNTKASPSNHVHPRYDYTASDHGLMGWSQDVASASSNSTVPAKGTLYLVKIHVPIAGPVTNVLLYVTAAGSGLTTGQNFAGLYSPSGTLLGATADQTSLWSSVGLQTMPLTGGPASVAAGDYYAGFVVNGTTAPGLARGNNQSATMVNVGLSTSTYRAATSTTGVTTSLPATAATPVASAYLWWMALS
jgi:hypothetical protein